MELKRELLIGTRGSRLALAQTNIVIDLIRQVDGAVEPKPVVVKTVGDIMPSGKLKGMDAKSAFTSEIDRRLIEGRIDVAVHSLKDVPSELDGRLAIAATPKRGDARDALVSSSGAALTGLERGSRIGTSSVRRRAQLLRMRPDLDVSELHGNVETRLRKLGDNGLAGVVLAAAGLERLGMGSRISQAFETEDMVPAVCQGILAVEARRDDGQTKALLSKINDPLTRAASECERAFAGALGGDCNVPLGAFASCSSGRIQAVGMVANSEGRELAKARISGPVEDAAALGRDLADRVEQAGGRRILKELVD